MKTRRPCCSSSRRWPHNSIASPKRITPLFYKFILVGNCRTGRKCQCGSFLYDTARVIIFSALRRIRTGRPGEGEGSRAASTLFGDREKKAEGKETTLSLEAVSSSFLLPEMAEAGSVFRYIIDDLFQGTITVMEAVFVKACSASCDFRNSRELRDVFL